jgi:hypothetical protein
MAHLLRWWTGPNSRCRTLDWELVGDQLTLADGSTVIELEDGAAGDEQD